MLLALVALQVLTDHRDLANQIDESRMRATIEHLAAYPNRNTNNPTLTEAGEWLVDEFKKIPGLQVELMHYTAPQGLRVPVAKDVVEVVATLPGRTDHCILVGGHFDSINMAVRGSLDGRAPGANDDASAVALTLELARIMSQRKWNDTLNFVCFSGEEQGLLGSAALALRAKREAWKLDAVLSNDIVGYSEALDGEKDKRHVRVFSEESPNHNSRELARFVAFVAHEQLRGFEPTLVYRRDRFQRGGDHTSFNSQGFTAVRFCEAIEEFTHQHNEKDTPDFIDYRYLSNVAKVNLLTMASLADAAEPPDQVRYDRAQAHDTTIRWQSTPGVSYVVYWRPTDVSTWIAYRTVGSTDHATIEKVNKDDHDFAVGAFGGIPVPAR